MHKFYFILQLLVGISAISSSQDHDNVWLMGNQGGAYTPNDTTFGITILRFPNGDIQIENNQQIEMWFNDTDASISDTDGNLLFYFNGIYIEDASYHTMENGEGLNNFNLNGYDLPQGGLILPLPNDSQKYYLFHSEEGHVKIPDWGPEVVGLYYSIIDMEKNNGLGGVVLKKEPLIIDTLEYGKITATKHANGRDWWLLMNESHTNRFYQILFDKDGVQVVGNQEIGMDNVEGLGQAVFSPDGNYYVMFNTVDLQLGQFIEIYDFDRCTGNLSNHRRIQYDEDAYSGGAAISPNSRFLYIPSNSFMYQYDLWADDIEASRATVAVYDGYLAPFPTTFFLAQLAPDNKIYISCSNGVNVLHVIHNPDEKGLACNVEQHGVHLPTFNGFSIPNFPNYRLGPLDGSPCATLGLDNMPVAKFRYEQDTLEYLQVEFTDLSYYEPAEWHWDFGDNTTSQETDPVHVFPQSGTYEVCLTVSNVNGENTFCRTLSLGTVSTSVEAQAVDINVFPNPCREGVNVIISEYLPRDAKVVLYDAVGQRHKVQSVQTGWNTLRLDGLRAGIYFYEIRERDILLKSGKLVKIE